MARCRNCGQEIEFEVTANGRPRPINPDGRVHFATCGKSPQEVAQRRKRAAKAKRLEKELDKQLSLRLR